MSMSCKNQGCRDPRGCQDPIRCVIVEECRFGSMPEDRMREERDHYRAKYFEEQHRAATATEAADAARDKALEEAIAEVTHVTSTAHDARVLALAAKRIELLRAKLRAAKEKP